MAQLRKPLVLVSILAVILITLAIGLRMLGPTRTPGGQPSLATLEAGLLPGFQARFDAARDSTRILVLLSPT